MAAGPDDDELDLPELPPLPPLGAEEEALGDEVGDDGLDVAEEGVSNLDDSEGVEGFDPGAFLDGSVLAEGESLLDDAPAELGDVASEAIDAPDDGWTGDDATGLEDDDLGAYVDEPSGRHASLDDGEEGPLGDDLELPPLPPLDADEGDDVDGDLDLGLDAEIGLGSLSVEAELRLEGRSVPPPAGARMLHWLAEPVVAAALADDVLWAVGAEVFRGDEDGSEARPARGLEAEDLVSIAPLDAERALVGTRLGGVYRTLDGGRTFEPANGWRSGGEPTVACHLLACGGRVWLWAGGALYRSEDVGGRWTGPLLPYPVLDVTEDVARPERVVALGRAGDGLRVASTSDGGVRWESRELPAAPTGFERGALSVAAHGDALGVLGEAPENGPWLPFGGAAKGGEGAIAFVFDARGRPCFALHGMGADRALVLRGLPPTETVFDRRGSGSARDPEGDHRVRLLRQARDVILVGLGAGLFVIEDAGE
ncbi:MAG: hypothetical protein AAGH15_02620 [Myxococcota bacterium]